MLGINLGGLAVRGAARGMGRSLPRLLKGDYWLEERMMLRAEHWRGGQALGNWEVVNEVVVCRGQFVRPIRVRDRWWMLPADHVRGRWADRRHAHRLHRLCPGGRRADLAARTAQHPDRAGRPASFGRPGHDSAGRRARRPCTVLQRPRGRVQRRWAGAHACWTMATRTRPASGHIAVHFVRFQDPGYFYRNLTTYMEQNPSANGVR